VWVASSSNPEVMRARGATRLPGKSAARPALFVPRRFSPHLLLQPYPP
jgi:hypothetical protein